MGEAVRLVDWPPKAACRDVRQRRYKPLTAPGRLVSTLPHVAAVGVLRTPTNRPAPPFASVPSFLL